MKYDKIFEGKCLRTDSGSLSNRQWLIRKDYVPARLERAAERLFGKINNGAVTKEQEDDLFLVNFEKAKKKKTKKEIRKYNGYKRMILVTEYKSQNFSTHFQTKYINMLETFFPGFDLALSGAESPALITHEGYTIGLLMPFNVGGDK